MLQGCLSASKPSTRGLPKSRAGCFSNLLLCNKSLSSEPLRQPRLSVVTSWFEVDWLHLGGSHLHVSSSSCQTVVGWESSEGSSVIQDGGWFLGWGLEPPVSQEDWQGLGGHPHQVDTANRLEAALGMASGTGQRSQKPGQDMPPMASASPGPAKRAPSWPRLLPWQRWRPGDLAAGRSPCRPWVRGRRGGRETLLWFCGQGGSILRIFRG